MSENNHEGMKKCPKCGDWKPATAEFFNRNKTRKDGLDSWCKDCNTERKRVYKEKNKDKIAEYRTSNVGRLRDAVDNIRRKTGATIYLRDMTEEQKETLANQYVAVRTLEKTEKELLAASGKKRCTACDRILDYGCFNKNITKNDGVNHWCRDCEAERQREYYQRNKDKVAERQREYYQRNKDKVAEYYREYYEKNKDKKKDYQRKYRQNKKNKKALDKIESIPDNGV